MTQVSSKKRTYVNVTEDGKVEIKTVSAEEFNSSDATVPSHMYVRQKENFDQVLADMRKIMEDIGDDFLKHPERSQPPAEKFLRVHGAWLHNLAKTGFVIEYTQFVRE